MERIINHIINTMLVKGVIEEKQKSVIAYGLDLLLLTVISMTVLLAIGFVLSQGGTDNLLSDSIGIVSGIRRGIPLPDASAVLGSDGLQPLICLACAAEAFHRIIGFGSGAERVSYSGHCACSEFQGSLQ